jgi:hypothetical protein
MSCTVGKRIQIDTRNLLKTEVKLCGFVKGTSFWFNGAVQGE